VHNPVTLSQLSLPHPLRRQQRPHECHVHNPVTLSQLSLSHPLRQQQRPHELLCKASHTDLNHSTARPACERAPLTGSNGNTVGPTSIADSLRQSFSSQKSMSAPQHRPNGHPFDSFPSRRVRKADDAARATWPKNQKTSLSFSQQLQPPNRQANSDLPLPERNSNHRRQMAKTGQGSGPEADLVLVDRSTHVTDLLDESTPRSTAAAAASLWSIHASPFQIGAHTARQQESTFFNTGASG